MFNQSLRTSRGKTTIALVLLVLFGIIYFRSLPNLWYWWDEFTILQGQQSPYFGVLTSHMGHFFPFGRFVFFIESQIFADYYIGLILINYIMSFLIIISVVRLSKNIFSFSGPLLRQIPLLLICCIWFLSAGMQYNVQWGLQIVWLLSVYFALQAAVQIYSAKVKIKLILFYLCMSWLSLSSNFVPVTILFIVLALPSPYVQSLSHRAKCLILSIVITTALLLSRLGVQLAAISPPQDARAIGSSLNFSFLIQNFWNLVHWSLTSSTSWLISPIWSPISTKATSFESLGNEIYQHPSFLILLNLIFIVLICIPIFTNSCRGTEKFLPLCFYLVSLVTSVIITAGRIGNFNSFLHVRYATVAGLVAIFFWLSILNVYVKQIRFLRYLALSILTSLLVTVCLSVLAFQNLVAQGSDRGRLQNTQQQLVELKKCGKPLEVYIFPTIQPALTGAEICLILEQFRE